MERMYSVLMGILVNYAAPVNMVVVYPLVVHVALLVPATGLHYL